MKPKELKGRISITRPIGGSGKTWMEVALTDDLSGLRFAEAKVELAPFLLALTGQSDVPCILELRLGGPIGYKHEAKTEALPVPQGEGYGHKASPQLRAAVKALEVDGWEADPDYDNHHRYTRTYPKKGGPAVETFSVNYHRWVDPKTGEPWKGQERAR